jgi:ADP-ribose pyrophosphatase
MPMKVLEKSTLHRGRVFRLMRERVLLSNGTTVDLDLIRHPGAAAMVPIARNNSLILIRQYRHAVGDFLWEIPAGTLNPDEEPLECAKRELIEETGFSAARWEKLGEIVPVPGYSDERIHIFLASELDPARQKLDPDEILNVHQLSLERAFEMIEEGAIQDSKTISSLFLARTWLKKNQ